MMSITKRHVVNVMQYDVLLHVFSTIDKVPCHGRCVELSRQIGMPTESIKKWFYKSFGKKGPPRRPRDQTDPFSRNQPGEVSIGAKLRYELASTREETPKIQEERVSGKEELPPVLFEALPPHAEPITVVYVPDIVTVPEEIFDYDIPMNYEFPRISFSTVSSSSDGKSGKTQENKRNGKIQKADPVELPPGKKIRKYAILKNYKFSKTEASSFVQPDLERVYSLANPKEVQFLEEHGKLYMEKVA